MNGTNINGWNVNGWNTRKDWLDYIAVAERGSAIFGPDMVVKLIRSRFHFCSLGNDNSHPHQNDIKRHVPPPDKYY